MSQWIQTDLLDLIAEEEAKQKKERTRLCPVLETWSNENIRHEQKLCIGWDDAVKNDNGVFTTHTTMFPMITKGGKFCDNRMELKIAVKFPYIHGELDFHTGSPFYYGRCYPVTEDSSILMSVYDDVEHARTYLTNFIIDSIDNDGNISVQRNECMKKYVEQLVDKAIRGMTCQ